MMYTEEQLKQVINKLTRTYYYLVNDNNNEAYRDACRIVHNAISQLERDFTLQEDSRW